VEKQISVGNKYLPLVRDAYPDEYTGKDSGFRVGFGYTLHYHNPTLATEADDDVDEEWDKFAAKWQRRYEESAWWKQKYRELNEAGYYLDDQGTLRRHDIPGLPDIDWTVTLREKLQWDPRYKPFLSTVVEEEEEGGKEKDFKGKGKAKLEDLEAEDPELDREVPSEGVGTSDFSDGKGARYSFEVGGGEKLTLKDPKDYDPPFSQKGSGPPDVKEEEQALLNPPADGSASSRDVYKVAASGTTAEQAVEVNQHLSANESEGHGSKESSLRKYWSSDDSEHWQNIKKALMPREEAKQQQHELELGQQSSSEAETPKKQAMPPKFDDSTSSETETEILKKPVTGTLGKKAKPPKLHSIFDDTSSSGDESSGDKRSKEVAARGKGKGKQVERQPSQSSKSSSGTPAPQSFNPTYPPWRFTLDPPPPIKNDSDADRSVSVYSQDSPSPSPNPISRAASPVRSSSPAPEGKGKALMEYIKSSDTNPEGLSPKDATQAQPSSESPAQLDPGNEKPEGQPEEESDSDSDESLTDSCADSYKTDPPEAQASSEPPAQPAPGDGKPDSDSDSDEDLNSHTQNPAQAQPSSEPRAQPEPGD